MRKTLAISMALIIAVSLANAQERGGGRERPERGGMNRPERGTESDSRTGMQGGMGSRMSDRRGGRSEGGMGGPGGGDHMMERLLGNAEIREKLGLSEKDVEKIRSELQKLQEEMIDLKAKMEKVGLRQARAMMDKEIDEDKLMDMVEEAGAIRTKMAKLQIKKMMLFRKHIDPEKMEQVRSQMQERMRERMKEHMKDREGEGGRRPEGMSRDRQGGTGRRRPGAEGDRGKGPAEDADQD